MNFCKNLIIWLIYFVPAILIELACYLLAPVVALCIETRPRFDRVKRLGNISQQLDRDYLIKPLFWFQTHDNAVDEWWYGLFNNDSYFKWLREANQADYDASKWLRYVCRVHWLWRNCGYGFLYHLLGKPIKSLTFSKLNQLGKEGEGFWVSLKRYSKSFQFECQIPLGQVKTGARFITINIGWKKHKGFNKVMYANRVIGFRKYK